MKNMDPFRDLVIAQIFPKMKGLAYNISKSFSRTKVREGRLPPAPTRGRWLYPFPRVYPYPTRTCWSGRGESSSRQLTDRVRLGLPPLRVYPVYQKAIFDDSVTQKNHFISINSTAHMG